MLLKRAVNPFESNEPQILHEKRKKRVIALAMQTEIRSMLLIHLCKHTAQPWTPLQGVAGLLSLEMANVGVEDVGVPTNVVVAVPTETRKMEIDQVGREEETLPVVEINAVFCLPMIRIGSLACPSSIGDFRLEKPGNTPKEMEIRILRALEHVLEELKAPPTVVVPERVETPKRRNVAGEEEAAKDLSLERKKREPKRTHLQTLHRALPKTLSETALFGGYRKESLFRDSVPIPGLSALYTVAAFATGVGTTVAENGA